MAAPIRITPEETRKKLKSGTALLVCAYDDESKFKQIQLEGGIPLSEFKSRLPTVEKDKEIIFYCA